MEEVTKRRNESDRDEEQNGRRGPFELQEVDKRGLVQNTSMYM